MNHEQLETTDSAIHSIRLLGFLGAITDDWTISTSSSESSGSFIYAETPTEVSISPAYDNLLENSTFQDTIEVVDDNGQAQQVARGWACSNTQNDLPRGAYRLDSRMGGRCSGWYAATTQSHMAKRAALSKTENRKRY